MSVQFVGATNQKMGTVPVAAPATFNRGDLVTLVNGLAVAAPDNAVANLAVALDMFPDVEYEGVKGRVDIAYLGDDQEVVLPFQGAAIAVANIGMPFNILALNGGTVNLALNNAASFIIRRFGDGVAVGDLTGTVVGVFTDAVSL